MLAACTGGQEYFRELRGVALKRAAYCLNRKQIAEGGSPYVRAWGSEFDWGNSSEHVFGAKCVFLLHAHEHEKFESRGRLGVWVGRNLKSNQHLVVPITWDCTERDGCWMGLGLLAQLKCLTMYSPSGLSLWGGWLTGNLSIIL